MMRSLSNFAATLLILSWTTLLLGLPANASALTFQDFDAAGTPYVGTRHVGTGAVPTVIGGGPTGNFLRLKDTTTQTINSVGFDRTDIGAPFRIIADFDFRITCAGNRSGSPSSCADGFSFVLLNTGMSGTSGAAPQLDELGRSYFTNDGFNPLGTFGVGFDTFNNVGETDNSVWLTFNNGGIVNIPISRATFDLATGTNGSAGAFHHTLIDLVLGGPTPNVTVTLTKAGGFSITPYSNYDLSGVTGLAPFESRLAFGSRSGGSAEAVDLDNINVQFQLEPIPEPATLLLLGTGLIGLGLTRRRRRIM